MDNMDFHKFWVEGISAPPPRRPKPKNKPVQPTGEIYPPTKDITCHCCDFRNLPIEPGTVDAVVTDIPWEDDWLPNVAKFAEWCAEVLKPNGVMVTWYGMGHAARCIAELEKHLHFQWILVSPLYGTVGGKRGLITSCYRAALVFTNGETLRLHREVDDWMPASRREKRWHPHQQSSAPTQYLVEAFSQVAELIVDPCAGSFTTAEACWHTHRRFVGGDINPECLGMAQERFKALGF
jgi:site-specific DNA-methyltransferase (adenine-specific)